ncbi:hypothetical protein SASPL_157911 [Salvia splendens]|uniref:Large ribosomal subunit protein mL54 n=1 Tax=Salvia splendens TaxID=180675 RepID=A0A8X8YTF3_SALSN|nr:hypothetical protein SASPL_157911 [Salvia splendens]
MAMVLVRSLKSITASNEVFKVVGCRAFAAGGAKAKKGKGGAAGDAPKASLISKEYPDWLWHLLDKRPALSELRRKDTESLPFDDLKRFVKLDNRARIKENNMLKAKN